jgi:transcription antitermination factor NusG
MNLWYALLVKPRFEQLIHRQLKNRGHEVLSPMYTLRQPGRNACISLPLFPGYVFCRFDILRPFSVLWQPGVNSVVRTQAGPVVLDDSEIESLSRALECSLHIRPSPYPEHGQRICISRGPLQGTAGFVVTSQGGERLIIPISSLQRAVSVDIDSEWMPVGA